MNKNIQSLSLALLITAPYIIANHPVRTIKLENPILSMIDGKQVGINGENVALTRKYQSNILDILLGPNTKNGRHGVYEFDGKKYNAQQLREIEEAFDHTTSHEHRDQMQVALKKMRDDFEAISEEFKETAKTSKPIMAMLIEESCQKRGRGNDSLILIWAKSKENEYTLFNRHVRSVKDFEVFMTDLYNFLGDLVASCPIAQRQLKERIEKFGKVHHLMQALSLTPEQQQKFLKYIQKHMNTLEVGAITEAKIKELYIASNK